MEVWKEEGEDRKGFYCYEMEVTVTPSEHSAQSFKDVMKRRNCVEFPWFSFDGFHIAAQRQIRESACRNVWPLLDNGQTQMGPLYILSIILGVLGMRWGLIKWTIHGPAVVHHTVERGKSEWAQQCAMHEARDGRQFSQLN